MDIASESTSKYQWASGGIESNVSTYGRLYTWYAVTDSRNVCPTGWHVPSYNEWYTLTDYLTTNGYGYQGSGNEIGKSIASTSGWTSDPTAGAIGNDQASNNSSGFTALPSEIRHVDGRFGIVGYKSSWWCSTDNYLTPETYSLTISCNSGIVSFYGSNRLYGFSVRCIKDN